MPNVLFQQIFEAYGGTSACRDFVPRPGNRVKYLSCERIKRHHVGHASMEQRNDHGRHRGMRNKLSYAPLQPAVFIAAGTWGSASQGAVLLAMPLY